MNRRIPASMTYELHSIRGVGWGGEGGRIIQRSTSHILPKGLPTYLSISEPVSQSAEAMKQI